MSMEKVTYLSPQVDCVEIEQDSCLCLSSAKNAFDDLIEDTYDW